MLNTWPGERRESIFECDAIPAECDDLQAEPDHQSPVYWNIKGWISYWAIIRDGSQTPHLETSTGENEQEDDREKDDKEKVFRNFCSLVVVSDIIKC